MGLVAALILAIVLAMLLVVEVRVRARKIGDVGISILDST